jgi:hypothetical protein
MILSELLGSLINELEETPPMEGFINVALHLIFQLGLLEYYQHIPYRRPLDD